MNSKAHPYTPQPNNDQHYSDHREPAHHMADEEKPPCDDRQFNICKDGRLHKGSEEKCAYFNKHCEWTVDEDKKNLNIPDEPALIPTKSKPNKWVMYFLLVVVIFVGALFAVAAYKSWQNSEKRVTSESAYIQ